MPKRPVRALIASLGLVAVLAASTLLFGAASAGQDRAVFLQSFVWRNPDPAFGGFSGIDFSDNGRSFVLLSDRTTLWRGKIQRDGAGRIVDIATAGPKRLHDRKGNPLGTFSGDSEGIALAPDGSVYISFEEVPRVVHYARDDGASMTLPRPPEFKKMPLNGSLESLAIDAAGALYTMPERSGDRATPFPVWRFKDKKWTQPFSIPRDGDWLPTGADFGPDGRFYLLERDFWGLLGFRSRVQVFDIAGDKISGGEVLFQTTAGVHDNLEGLSVWRDDSGAIRLTMVSDDNFSAFQRTELVEYRISH